MGGIMDKVVLMEEGVVIMGEVEMVMEEEVDMEEVDMEEGMEMVPTLCPWATEVEVSEKVVWQEVSEVVAAVADLVCSRIWTTRCLGIGGASCKVVRT